jgi:hypothetical protein
MIRHTARFLARATTIAAMIGSASVGYAGAGTVTPALAACSKALVETISKSEQLPTYTVKAPSLFVSEMVDPFSFTVLAHNVKTRELLAKASCKATPEGRIVSFKSIPLKS